MNTNTVSKTVLTGFSDVARPDKWRADLVNPGTWIGAMALAVIFLVGAWLLGRAVRLAIHRYLDDSERAGSDPTGIRFLGQLANIGVYVFAFLFYSHLVPVLNGVGTAWLTSVGVVSVVVGLAAQSTLGNLISGISLVLYRPFKVGDLLEISGPQGPATGRVESINLGTTVLLTADNRRLVIPNNTMASQISINLSAARQGAPTEVSVTVAANADVAAARRILTDLASAHPKIVAVDNCWVTALSAAGTTVTLHAWCADAAGSALLKSDVLENAKKQFDAAGLKIV